MPARRIVIDGREWQVYPSGFLTQSVADEFGLIFVHGAGSRARGAGDAVLACGDGLQHGARAVARLARRHRARRHCFARRSRARARPRRAIARDRALADDARQGTEAMRPHSSTCRCTPRRQTVRCRRRRSWKRRSRPGSWPLRSPITIRSTVSPRPPRRARGSGCGSCPGSSSARTWATMSCTCWDCTSSDTEAMREALTGFQRDRIARAEHIVATLNRLGIPGDASRRCCGRRGRAPSGGRTWRARWWLAAGCGTFARPSTSGWAGVARRSSRSRDSTWPMALRSSIGPAALRSGRIPVRMPRRRAWPPWPGWGSMRVEVLHPSHPPYLVAEADGHRRNGGVAAQWRIRLARHARRAPAFGRTTGASRLARLAGRESRGRVAPWPTRRREPGARHARHRRCAPRRGGDRAQLRQTR